MIPRRPSASLRISGRCERCSQPASSLISTTTERHRFCARCAEAWWDAWWAARGACA